MKILSTISGGAFVLLLVAACGRDTINSVQAPAVSPSHMIEQPAYLHNDPPGVQAIEQPAYIHQNPPGVQG